MNKTIPLLPHTTNTHAHMHTQKPFPIFACTLLVEKHGHLICHRTSGRKQNKPHHCCIKGHHHQKISYSQSQYLSNDITALAKTIGALSIQVYALRHLLYNL